MKTTKIHLINSILSSQLLSRRCLGYLEYEILAEFSLVSKQAKALMSSHCGTLILLNSISLLCLRWQDIPPSLEIPPSQISLTEIILGNGKQALIKYGSYKGHAAAFKIFHNSSQDQKGLLKKKKELLREVVFMSRVRGPGIVNLWGVSKLNDNLCLVMQYMNALTLKIFLKKKQDQITYIQALNFGLQIIKIISHIHHQEIIHGDLHAYNIYVDGNEKITIGDFGSAHDVKENDFISSLLTSGYPPEFYNGKIFKASDIFYFGKILNMIKFYNQFAWGYFNPIFDNLINRCMNSQWRLRPSAIEVYNQLTQERERVEKLYKHQTKKLLKPHKIYVKTPIEHQTWTQLQLDTQLKEAGFTRTALAALLSYRDIEEWKKIINTSHGLYLKIKDLKSIDESIYVFFLAILQKFVEQLVKKYQSRSIFGKNAYLSVYEEAHLLMFHVAYDAFSLHSKEKQLLFQPQFFVYSETRAWFQREFFEHFRAEAFCYQFFLEQIHYLEFKLSHNSFPAEQAVKLLHPLTNLQLISLNKLTLVDQETGNILIRPPYKTEFNLKSLNNFDTCWPILLKTRQCLLRNDYIEPWWALYYFNTNKFSNMAALGQMIDKGLIASFAYAMTLNIKLQPREVALLLEKALTYTPVARPGLLIPQENYWPSDWAAHALLKSTSVSLWTIFSSPELWEPKIILKLKNLGINLKGPIIPTHYQEESFTVHHASIGGVISTHSQEESISEKPVLEDADTEAKEIEGFLEFEDQEEDNNIQQNAASSIKQELPASELINNMTHSSVNTESFFTSNSQSSSYTSFSFTSTDKVYNPSASTLKRKRKRKRPNQEQEQKQQTYHSPS